MTRLDRDLLADAHQRLHALYDDRLVHVILYGSRARGDARPDSDVDILVVLEGAVDIYTEIKRMSALKLALFSAYGLVVSLQPIAAADYEARRSAFVRAVQAEGVPAPTT